MRLLQIGISNCLDLVRMRFSLDARTRLCFPFTLAFLFLLLIQNGFHTLPYPVLEVSYLGRPPHELGPGKPFLLANELFGHLNQHALAHRGAVHRCGRRRVDRHRIVLISASDLECAGVRRSDPGTGQRVHILRYRADGHDITLPQLEGAEVE